MFYLLLAILSSTANGIILRCSKKFVKNKLSMLAGNYLTCLILALVYSYPLPLFPKAPLMGNVITLSVINGILLLAGFVIMQHCVLNHGVVMTSVFSRLGVLVPTLASVLFFHEKPTMLQAAGFLLSIYAIFVMNRGLGMKGIHISLVAVLLMNGSGDCMAKIYEQAGSPSLSENYLVYSFFIAFILNVLLCIYKKERPSIGDIGSGLILGIPNYYGARFLLKAVAEVPAFIVYPTFSVGNIAAMTLFGIILFKEHLSKNQKAAILVIMVSLILLNL